MPDHGDEPCLHCAVTETAIRFSDRHGLAPNEVVSHLVTVIAEIIAGARDPAVRARMLAQVDATLRTGVAEMVATRVAEHGAGAAQRVN